MPVALPPDLRRNLGYPAPVQPILSPASQLNEKVRASVVAGRVQFLPWLDWQTRETPEMRRTYRHMWKTPVVKAALLGKVLSVASLDLQTHPADDSDRAKYVADFARDAVLACDGGMLKIAETVLMPALIDGHSVSEKGIGLAERGKWKGRYVYQHLKGKDTEYGPSVKLVTDEFLNVTGVRAYGFGQAQVWDPKGFVLLSHLSLFESPAGMSDLRAVYAPYWRLDTIQKLRIIHLEKWTSPLLKGEYPVGDVTGKDSVERAMEQAKANTWFSIPDGLKVEAMQVAVRGEAEFAAAVRDENENIALAIAGAFLQLLTAVGGGHIRGSAGVQKSTAELFVWYLAELLATRVLTQQMIPDVIDPNFADADYPRATLGGVNDDDLKASADLDDVLLNKLGLRLSRKERLRYYGRQAAADDADALTPVQPGASFPGAGADVPDGGDPQAGAVQGNDLRSTVGGMQAVAALQSSYYAGTLPREAAIANVQLLFGFEPAEAEALFPPVAPTKLAPDAGTPPNAPKPFAEPPQPAAKPTPTLAVPDVRQDADFDCGAAAFMAVCRYFGVGPEEEAAFVEALGTSEETGTEPDHMLGLAQELGLACVADTQMTLGDLEYWLGRGRPVITPVQMYGEAQDYVNDLSGHYVVVRGLTPTDVLIQDPVSGPLSVPRAEWDANWHDTDADGRRLDHYGIAVWGHRQEGGGGAGRQPFRG